MLVRYPRAGRRDIAHRQNLLRVRGRSLAWLPPLLLLVCVTVADFGTGGEFRMISWIVLVPGIAAAICGVWGTAVFGMLALITYVAADSAWPYQYQTGLPDLILVAAGGVLATLACGVRLRGEQRMLHMMRIAETTRRTVLRPMPPGWGDLEQAAVYLAADLDARVGGDFYDIQPSPHGTRVLLGDVQGKGLGAVEAAAALLGTFREAGYHEADLATVAARLETRMLRHRGHTAALGRSDGDRFATAVLLGFPVAGPAVVEVAIFGHDPPLAVGPDGVRSLPDGDGLPLGLCELTGADGMPTVRRVPLAPGETLLLVTDGVTEARDAAGVFYPLVDEVARAVAVDPRTADPDRLVAFVRDGTLRHSAGYLADDTTIFAVRPRPRAVETPVRGRSQSSGPPLQS
ncbi:PP2C family protein-serine/threonine phosphatase [Streptomyces sp. NPDC002088]|uniref:PP2C family protein-serine/threonine phosphatase n=1 Tax=Streptomyces sp. NPDC002088 TaxID=3154665 RepID=UPI00332309A9